MAGCINQANVKFSNIFRKGPGTYRDLAQDQDQDQDQIVSGPEISVELKSTAEEEEEVGDSFAHRCQSSNRKWTNLAKIAVTVTLFFIAGYLVGYVTHRRSDASLSTAFSATSAMSSTGTDAATRDITTEHTTDSDEEPESKPDQSETTRSFAHWSSITTALREKLTTEALDKTLNEFSSPVHEAGSAGDHILGQKVIEKFKSLEMKTWMDVHYVKLQVPSGGSKVFIGSDLVGSPKGYLAYSAKGTKQGKVVYANYGQREDLEKLKNEGITLTENIALVRAGKLSLSEKVANAARFGLAAILIYREPSDNNERELDTELYGQVHHGTGDPYTPGFPSFNHTQFPPSKSSGLPEILAQTITAKMACQIHQKMGGKNALEGFSGTMPCVRKYTLGGETNVSVTVNNDLVDTKIYNVFGVIKGFLDPDRYVVLGAQRDAFSNGFAKSTVGTSLLLELARAITDMMKDGFMPRRSIMFASWSAGDFGSVGSTEWLEGYLSSLNLRAFTYISLDSTVSGIKQFSASSSPLLHRLLKKTMDEVHSPRSLDKSLCQDFAASEWGKVLEPMKMEDGAYPFLAFSGIPSISFRFRSDSSSVYKYSGTALDTRENLNLATEGKLLDVSVSAAQMAGQIALRLVHDHILNLDFDEYVRIMRMNMVNIMREIKHVEALNVNVSLTLQDSWLNSAIGSFSRAASALHREIKNSDVEDAETCRNINGRIMRVEHNLLSPYVSPKDVPFRHIIFGSGDYSVSSLLEHLSALGQQAEGSDADLFRNQFALITWTIQSCANDLAGDVWALDNLI